MNRIKSINLLIVLGLSLSFFQSCADKERNNPLDPGADNFGTFSEKRTPVLSENFESYGTGLVTTLSVFPWQYALSMLSMEIVDAIGVNNTRALRVNAAGATAPSAYFYNLQLPLKGRYEITFFIKNDSAFNTQHLAAFKLTGNPHTINYLSVGVNKLAQFYWNNSVASGAMGNYSFTGTYQIKIEVNTEIKRFSAWYKSTNTAYTLLADNIEIPGLPDTVPGFAFHVDATMNATQTTIFDNLDITKIEYIK